MKPPMKSDAGPTAWIVYDQEVAKRSAQEFIDRERNQIIDHLHFLVISEPKCLALMIVPEITSRSLSVIKKGSQAISLIPPKIIDVVAKTRSPRRRKTMAKQPERSGPAVEHPERLNNEDSLFTANTWRAISAVLCVLMLFLLCWNHFSCNNCKKDAALPIDVKSKGAEQAVVVRPTRVPTEVPAEAKGMDYQRLVIHNQSPSIKTVTVILKGQGKEKTFRLNPGEEQAFGTYELTARVMIEGVMQDPIPLKRLGTRKFAIRG